MKYYKKTIIFPIVLFIVCFAVPLVCSAQDVTNYSLEKIFYLAPYNAQAGVDSVNANYADIDILAPQMYTVNSQLLISGSLGPKLKAAITAHNIKVMPLIANGNFSQTLMHQLLQSPIAQDAIIKGLVYIAKKDNYIGWQFDFEHISYQDKDLYSQFVEKTYQSFEKNNLILSVLVVGRTADYGTTDAFNNWSGAYDYQTLAENSDFVSVMAYDDPNSVGPVASLAFVNGIVQYALTKIPPQKLSLGVPLYYWKWSVATDTKIGSGFYKNVGLIESLYPYTTGFDDTLGVSWLDYTYNGKEYKIWFEDEQSLNKKIDVIKNNNLRGFSAWLLGGEDSEIWDLLAPSSLAKQ